MVVEEIVNGFEIENKPYYAFFLAVFLASLGILVCKFFLTEHISVAMLFFVAIGATPMFKRLFRNVAAEGAKEIGLRQLLKRNSTFLKVYAYFFAGLVAIYIVWYTISGPLVFGEQVRVLGLPVGNAVFPFNNFLNIFLNNILVFSIFFFISLLYRTGSILVLSWNASVFASLVAITANRISSSGYLSAVSRVAFAYMFHALPEFFAYFLAAIAGAILSVSLAEKRYKNLGWNVIFYDICLLLFFGYVAVFAGAVIEVTFSREIIFALVG